MARLTIVIGANGAGKSTWARSHRRELPADFHDTDSIAQGLGSHDSDGAGRYPLSRRFRRRVGRLRPGACAGAFRRPRASPRAQRWRRRSVQAALRGRRAAREPSAGPHLPLLVSRGRCRVRLAAGETLEQPFEPRHALAQVGYGPVSPGDVLVLDRERTHPARDARAPLRDHGRTRSIHLVQFRRGDANQGVPGWPGSPELPSPSSDRRMFGK